MCCTCSNVEHMPKMIQVRNVPDDLHRTLKVRAAESGMTLSDYVLRELEEVAGKPTLSEFVAWLREQPGAEIGDRAVEIIREHRGPLP
jgi:antitoxin FitA